MSRTHQSFGWTTTTSGVCRTRMPPLPRTLGRGADVRRGGGGAARRLLLGPLRPGAPLRVSLDWICGMKGTMLQQASNHRALFTADKNSNLAMLPWAPSCVPSTAAVMATKMMDAVTQMIHP